MNDASQAGEGSLLARIGRNAGFLLSAKGLSAALGLAYLALAARALGASQLGVLMLIHSVIVTIREIASFRSWQALIKFGTDYLEAGELARFRRLLRLTTRLDLAGAVLGTIVSVGVVMLFASALSIGEEHQLMALGYCATTLIALRSTPIGLLRIFDRFDLLARQALVVPCVRTAGVALGWSLDLGLPFYVGVWLLSDALASVVLLVLGWRELKRQQPGLLAVDDAQAPAQDGLWPFLWWANLQSTVAAIATNAPVLLSGALVSSSAAAYVKVSQELANVLAKPAQLLSEVVYPEAARLVAQAQGARLRELLFRVSRRGIVVIGTVVSLGSLGAAAILGTLFGTEYREAAPVLRLFFVSAGAMALAVSCEAVLFSLGQARTVFLARACAVAALVGAIGWLAERAGAVGIGIAMAIYGAVACTLLWSTTLAATRATVATTP